MTRIGENPAAPPKRLYKHASLAQDGALLLDGKLAKTRALHAFRTTSKSLAAAIADEWNAQGEEIAYASMPMTRFQMTVIDRGAADARLWREAALAFLRSDLICYRAAAPAELVTRQDARWNPLLAWAGFQGISLRTCFGVGFIDQPQASLEAGAAGIASADFAQILAIKTLAEISGSFVIALALRRGAFDAQALFEASRIDETYQSEKWGSDAAAEARRRQQNREFLDAARYSMLAAGAG